MLVLDVAAGAVLIVVWRDGDLNVGADVVGSALVAAFGVGGVGAGLAEYLRLKTEVVLLQST